ncbi:hypothetical protein BO71DRAFT_86261 [Aspergillus ellipticus CBS 707.79]|uniref:Uncharacterized protein n=1 Tax=Aspergillus ellipticus CBS 707.79 TaxID=1448320 RepID=A0A319F4J5_9EURO|nr:hypothetical protein BO71DRAFT_86261 [Aspergillus ellipticus CBS 707.79]
MFKQVTSPASGWGDSWGRCGGFPAATPVTLRPPKQRRSPCFVILDSTRPTHWSDQPTGSPSPPGSRSEHHNRGPDSGRPGYPQTQKWFYTVVEKLGHLKRDKSLEWMRPLPERSPGRPMFRLLISVTPLARFGREFAESPEIRPSIHQRTITARADLCAMMRWSSCRRVFMSAWE